LQMGKVAGKKRRVVHLLSLAFGYLEVWRATNVIVPIEFCGCRGAAVAP
jgi:predicted metal-binding membrane protein